MNKLQYQVKLYQGGLVIFSILVEMIVAFLINIPILKLHLVPFFLGMVMFFLPFILPFVFIKKIKAIFTRKILIEMDKDYFSVSYLDSDGERVKKQRIFPWDSIQSYNFYIGGSSPTVTALTLHLKKGLPRSFNFVDKELKDTKLFAEMFKEECLVRLFHNQAKEYNAGKPESEQINLLAGFFASKTGTVVIYMLVVLIVAAIVIHLIIAPKSSFATLMISIGLVAGFFSKKQDSVELYRKIKELDNE